MAPIGDKPFLYYQMKYLISRGVNRIILSVGYKAEVIQDYFGSSFEGIPLQYVYEESPLGTGGGVRLALDSAQTEQVLVCNGDTFFEFELSKLQFVHRQSRGLLTFSVKEINNDGRYGGMQIAESGVVQGFTSKNITGKTYINAGIYLINKTAFLESTPAEKAFSLEDDFLAVKVNEGLFFACPFDDSQFIDIGIPIDYERGQTVIPEWASQRRIEFQTIFLDRDGVLNKKIDGGYVTRPEELEILPGVTDKLKSWKEEAKELFIITNQRGIARGIMTEEALHAVHFALLKEFEKEGISIRDIKFCPDPDNSSPRRKPNPGMLLELFEEYLHLNKETTLFIGDSISDLQAGKAAGVATCFLTKGQKTTFETLKLADWIAENLGGVHFGF